VRSDLEAAPIAARRRPDQAQVTQVLMRATGETQGDQPIWQLYVTQSYPLEKAVALMAQDIE
jgi:hypothetical protein